MPRVFAREFKLSLCRRIRAGELTAGKACREHGLSSGMLGRWLHQYEVQGDHAFQGQPWRSVALNAAERIEQLEEELLLARLETALVRQMLDQKKSESGSGRS
jgi:transposase-like protein